MPKLEVVTPLGAIPEPPYPPDIRAAGWRFNLDTTRIRQSDTWTLARPEIRPWLLMLWVVAWEQSPCGSLPADEGIVAALLGIDAALFTSHQSTIMRGWKRHADGRLYHKVITDQVIEMIAIRENNRDRQLRFRQHRNALLTRESPVSNGRIVLNRIEKKSTTTKPKTNTIPPDRGTRMDPGMECPDEWRDWVVEAYGVAPGRAVAIFLEFRDHWADVPGKAGRKVRWFGTFRNRCRALAENNRL